MKLNTFFLKLIFATIAAFALPAIGSAQITDGTRVYLMSSLLNFSRGQAVSLNFTNVDRQVRDARLNIVDANGETLKTATGRVLPGQSVSLNFTYGELPRGAALRAGVRGVVVLVTPPEPDADPPSPDLSLANLEIYDVLTGKTSFGLLLPAVRSLNVYFPTDQ